MLALNPLALILSTACALALAGSDYFRKAVPHTVPTQVVLFYFLAGQILLLGLWLFLNPWQQTPTFAPLMGSAYWRPGLIDAAASFVGNSLFIVAVRRSPMSMVVPLLSLIPVFTLALAALILNEWPPPRQDLGVLLTAAGVFCVYQPPGIPLSPAAVWRNFRAEPGAGPMLAVAVSWALTAPLDKLALAQAGVGLHALVQVSLLGLAVTVWVLMTPKKCDRGRRWDIFAVPPGVGRILAGASITAGLSYALQLAAYQLTLVAFVEALKRSIEISAVVATGVLVLGERMNRHKVIGLGLIICGVPLTVLPGAA